jgi:hypothetical protein
LAIEWQLSHVDKPLLSKKDKIGQLFCDADIHN